MSATPKPFACPISGCSMSFSNEDHLTVHKQKHEMILNLENNNKSNIYIVDQTPTPTRFIRSCEEVGLFQDLQNVNPFEETFRRAVEAGEKMENGVLHDSDTLHTPHIFPSIGSCHSVDEQISADVDIVGIGTDNNSRDDSLDAHNNEAGNESAFGSIEKTVNIVFDSTVDPQIAIDSPAPPKIDSEKTTSSLCLDGEQVQLLLKTANGKLMQLSAIPVIVVPESSEDYNCGGKSSNVVIETVPGLDCVVVNPDPQNAFVKKKLKQVLGKNKATHLQSCEMPEERGREEGALCEGAAGMMRKKGSSSIGELHKMKQERRERNRASSMRCRARRKELTEQLQRTISCANEKNAAMQLEIKNLHSEVARLKTQLLAHANCSVTKALQQEKGNGVILCQTAQVLPSSIQQSEIVTIPNKNQTALEQKIRSSVKKHSVILPKPDNFHVSHP